MSEWGEVQPGEQSSTLSFLPTSSHYENLAETSLSSSLMSPSLTLSPLQARQCDISPGRAYFSASNRSRKGKERANDEDSEVLSFDEASSFSGQDGLPALLETLRSISRKKQTGRYTARNEAQIAIFVPTPALDKHGHLLNCPEELPDELAWKGHTLVWSKGNTVFRKYSYTHSASAGSSSLAVDDANEPSGRIIQQALFAYFEVPARSSGSDQQEPHSQPVASTSSLPDTASDNSLFGPFREPLPPAWSDDNANASATRATASTLTSVKIVRALCVRFWDNIYLYYPDGAHHVVPIDFPVKTVWPLDRGILLERDVNAVGHTASRFSWEDEESTAGQSAYYVLLDPFDSVKPVAKARILTGIPDAFAPNPLLARQSVTAHGQSKPMPDLDERVVFTSGSRSDGSEPIIVTLHKKKGRLSVWTYSQVPASPKSTYNQFKQRIMQQELAESEANWPVAANMSNGTMQDDVATGRLPSAIGKRRRSEQSAIEPLPGAAASTAAQRQISTLLDRRKSTMNPNASVVDFLEAMGTDTRGFSAGNVAAAAAGRSSQGAEQPLRRASTALSSEFMNRRHSAVRTELSVSLNRMALGSQRKQSLANGAVAEAIMGADELVQPGHGEIERETSFVIEEYREEREQTDFYMARLGSVDVSDADQIAAQTESNVGENAIAAIFDVRGGTSTLAICLPVLKILYLYRISREAGQEPSSSKIVCSPIRQMEAVSICPVYGFRHAQQDLAVVDSSGKLCILADCSTSISMNIAALGLQKNDKIVRLEQASAASLIVTITSACGSSERKKVDLDYRMRDRRAIEIFEVLAHVLPIGYLMDCLTAFLAQREHCADLFGALEKALLPSGASEEMDSSTQISPWEALLASTSRQRQKPVSTRQTCPLPPYLAEVTLFALHLLGQEWQLLCSRQNDAKQLSGTIAGLAAHLGMTDYLDANARDGQLNVVPQVPSGPHVKTSEKKFADGVSPSCT